MIKKEPYGISGARIVRGEDRPFVAEAVFTNDPPEMVQRCLNCTALSCSKGTCTFAPDAKAYRKYKKKPKQDTPAINLTLAKKVTDMIYDGWREAAIAFELGVPGEEVRKAVETAQKEGLLG